MSTARVSDERLIRLENLRRVMNARSLKYADLTQQLGSRYTFWRDLFELPTKSFGEKLARKIESGLGLPRTWLDTPQTDVPPLIVSGSKIRYSVQLQAVPAANVRQVWVVGKTQGGMPERIWNDGDMPVGSTDQYADVSTTDEHAFACRVVGDSMVPRYMPGEFALVEPGTPPELEDDVLVRLTTGETMLKRLLSRRSGIRLGSYNGSEILTFTEEQVSWMYYVAHPIPAKRIRQRMDDDQRDAPPTAHGDLRPDD